MVLCPERHPGLILPARLIVPQELPPSHLRGEWRFRDAVGTLLGDLSRYRNHGTISGASWTSGGPLGTFLRYAAGDYVQAADAASLRLGARLTIIIAIRFVTLNNANTAWVQRYLVGDKSYILFHNTGNQPTLAITVDGSTVQTSNAGTALLANTWYLIGAVYNGSTSQLYSNGAADGAAKSMLGTIWAGTQPLQIGGTYFANAFAGDVGFCLISSVAFSASEMLAWARVLGYA